MPATVPLIGRDQIESFGSAAVEQNRKATEIFEAINSPLRVGNSGRSINAMSEREFADYQMRESHRLGIEADATKYQRAYQDILAAGLNPRLLLDHGDVSGVSASSAYTASESKSQSKSSSFSTSALIVGLAALILKSIL